MDDRALMREALREAQAAYNRGECAVGAVLARDGAIVACAGNRESELNDPTAHAEILVLREAGRLLGQHTFTDCTVYTTLWPCPMCENAMLRAKIRAVVCGARSFKYIYEVTFNPSNLPKVGPIMDQECRDIFIQWLKKRELTFILDHEGPLTGSPGSDENGAVLFDLEQRLAQVGKKLSAEEAFSLIGDDFLEFGSSGKVWTKAEIIAAMAEWEAGERIVEDFTVRELSATAYLVTYRAIRSDRKAVSLRSSIWCNSGHNWQIVFHQGTSVI